MNPSLKKVILVIAVAVGFALMFRLLFDLEILKNFAAIMSFSFFIFIPMGMGALTIALSPKEWLKNGAYPIPPLPAVESPGSW